MKRLAFTRIVLWILVGILIVMIFSGCRQHAEPTSVTRIGPSAKLYTVEHDGHTFVVFYANAILGKAGAMVHHPDCLLERDLQ